MSDNERLNQTRNTLRNITESGIDNAENIGRNLFSKGEGVANQVESNFSLEEFKKFASETIRGLVILTIYFYFGASFLILCKNAKANPEGLYGQDMNKPPYTGPFSECDLFDISKPLSDWSFPYKNSTLCDKHAIINRPLYYRIVSYFVTIIAWSYSTGRQILNRILFSANDSVVLFGPLIFIAMLILSPIVIGVTNLMASIINYDKLLPNCYFTFWFPITSLFIYFFGINVFTVGLTLVQLIHLIAYILYPTFGKLDVIDENGNKIKSNGILTVLNLLFKNMFYLIVVGALIIINLYTYMNARVSIPIIIIIVIFSVLRYLI
jgi:hypothetical protein